MKAFIRAMGNLSPQDNSLQQLVVHEGKQMRCVEPDYLQIIDPKLIRRMSRIIKMGTAAALGCLKEAGIAKPDAITMGTAYGCLEDTGILLKKLVEQQEQMLSPTAFIQSTHNTIGAQIALILQCQQYNNTFVHRGFSFESALLDAVMLLEEGAAGQVLTGAADEITGYSQSVLERFGLYKGEAINNTQLFDHQTKGSMAGEGAAFFLLDSKASGADYATIDGMHSFYKPGSEAQIRDEIEKFLSARSLSATDIDLVITGKNGDWEEDELYRFLGGGIFANKSLIPYKHLCGEYPTSTAFACWLAAKILRDRKLPAVYPDQSKNGIRRVLIYNHYQSIHHSLLLLGAC